MLKPTAPLTWGSAISIAPAEFISIEATGVFCGSTWSTGAANFTFGVPEVALSTTLGPVHAGGIFSTLDNPLPAKLKANTNLTSTPHSVTYSLPTPVSSTSQNAEAVITLNMFDARFFFVKKTSGEFGGGISYSTPKKNDGKAGVSLASALTTRQQPAFYSKNWFATHPYTPERQVTTLLHSGIFHVKETDRQLKIEETVGQSVVPLQQNKWFSKTGITVSLGNWWWNGLFFICDNDFLTAKGNRLRDTLRTGGNIRWNGRFVHLGGSTNWTIHNEDQPGADSVWQQYSSLYSELITSSINTSFKVTYTDDGNTDDEDEEESQLLQNSKHLQLNEQISFQGGSLSVTQQIPLPWNPSVDKLSGTMAIRLIPLQWLTIDTGCTLKTGSITKLTAGTAVRSKIPAGICTTVFSLTYAVESQTLSWSLTATAKWK